MDNERVFHSVIAIAGAALGAVGFGIQIWFSHRPMLFLLSLVLIASSEVITCMQTYIKEEYAQFGARSLRLALRLQYASNVAGTCIGFAGAGALGFLGARDLIPQASFGLFLEVMELLLFGWYLWLSCFVPESKANVAFMKAFSEELIALTKDAHGQKPVDGSQGSQVESQRRIIRGRTMRWGLNALKDPHDSPAQISSDLVLLDCTDQSSGTPHVMNQILSGGLANQEKHGRDAKEETLQWINYVVAITFAIQALMIGTVLSTGPILLHVEYGIPLQYIGLLFGFGEFLGTLAMLFLIPHKSRMRTFVPGPFNIICVLFTMGVMACTIALDMPYLSMTLISLIMGLNDFGTSLTAETQGATIAPPLYPKLNMLSNVSRRLGNTMTAILGPILYQVNRYAPFIMFGFLTIFWSMLLLLLFETRGTQVVSKIGSPESIKSTLERPLPGLRHYYQAQSFVSSELKYRSTRRKQRRERASLDVTGDT